MSSVFAKLFDNYSHSVICAVNKTEYHNRAEHHQRDIQRTHGDVHLIIDIRHPVVADGGLLFLLPRIIFRLRHDFILLSRFNKKDRFQKNLPIINRQAFVVSQILLAGHVLAHIQNARNEDNRALDDVGDVA